MLVYLDARDLISVFEQGKPCDAKVFIGVLRAGGHALVLSMSNVREVSAPLVDPAATTNVMRLLNEVEEAPIRYIREGTLVRDELKKALDAFSHSREYQSVFPFVDRYDQTFELEPLPTRLLLHHGLAETIFTLWGADRNTLRPSAGHAEHLRKQFAAERGMKNRKSLAENFVDAVERHLNFHRLPLPTRGVRPFAEWIYEDPARCPSYRLSYEVYHAVLNNIGDVPKDGYIPDFAHLQCTPYVDLITLDRRMITYVQQVSSRLRLPYPERTCRELNRIIEKLTIA